jgi:predicted PurR-regulated permease PerM
MNPLLSLNISIGIVIVLVAIMVYCVYKAIDGINTAIDTFKEYKKAQQELIDYVNKSKSYTRGNDNE